MNESQDYGAFAAYGAMPPVSMAPAVAPRYALFDFQAVSLATFLGTPAAGAVLLAANYQRLGRRGAALLTVLVGVVVAALALLLGYAMPTGSAPLGLGLLVATSFVARKLQGTAIAEHKAAGGPMASRWAAAGVGLAFLVVVVAAVATPIYLGSQRGKVLIGTKDEVYFTGSATKQDGQALGEALKKIGYFQDRGTSVFLDKDAQGATVSLVQQEGVWDQPDMLANSEEVVREVADSIGGFPVRVKLINAAEDVKKTGVIGRVVVGTKDEIFYEGTATSSEATALGKALKDDKYFQDRGTTVLVSKDGRGTVLSFVVAEGVWDEAGSVTAFEVIAKGVAPTIGGLPLSMRMVNSVLENKREVKIN